MIHIRHVKFFREGHTLSRILTLQGAFLLCRTKSCIAVMIIIRLSVKLRLCQRNNLSIKNISLLSQSNKSFLKTFITDVLFKPYSKPRWLSSWLSFSSQFSLWRGHLSMGYCIVYWSRHPFQSYFISCLAVLSSPLLLLQSMSGIVKFNFRKYIALHIFKH